MAVFVSDEMCPRSVFKGYIGLNVIVHILELVDPRTFEDELRRVSVPPCEHLFRNDVRLLAHPTRKQLRRLENRRTNFLEVVRAKHFPHFLFYKIPKRCVRRQKISRSSTCLDHLAPLT